MSKNLNLFSLFFTELKNAVREEVIKDILGSLKPQFATEASTPKKTVKRKKAKKAKAHKVKLVAAPTPVKKKRKAKSGTTTGKIKAKGKVVKASGQGSRKPVKAKKQKTAKVAAPASSTTVQATALVTTPTATKAKKPNSPFRVPVHCIATGCDKPHKGPRFRYLCDEHRTASREQYEGWRRERATRATEAVKKTAKTANGKTHSVTAETIPAVA